MSDDKNLTENPDQVVDVPEVIDTDPINSNDPAEMLEVSGIESSVDGQSLKRASTHSVR